MPPTTAVGRLLSVNVGLPRDVEWDGRTVHTGIWKEPGRRAADGPAPQHRRRRAGRPAGARRRQPRRVRLPDRILPLLGEVPRTRRLHLRAVRRELHRRGPGRRRGLHRRPLPDRLGAVRGQPAEGHLLPGRHPDERAADARAARRAPPSRLLLPGPRGGRGRGRRRDRARRARPGGDDGRGDRRPALPAAQGAPRPGARAADPGAEPGLAGVVPRPARPGAGRRGDRSWPGRDCGSCGWRRSTARART